MLSTVHYLQLDELLKVQYVTKIVYSSCKTVKLTLCHVKKKVHQSTISMLYYCSKRLKLVAFKWLSQRDVEACSESGDRFHSSSPALENVHSAEVLQPFCYTHAFHSSSESQISYIMKQLEPAYERTVTLQDQDVNRFVSPNVLY